VVNWTPHAPERISLIQLDEVLARADAEEWDQLDLIGPRAVVLGPPPKNRHVFHLSEPAARIADKLTRLTKLKSLRLGNNDIDGESAQALAGLTNLTSLDLSSNNLGDEGARALAALTDLTSLDLSSNGIREDGARALAALTNLTSLDLADNYIGDEGAHALAALTNLTSLNLSNSGIHEDGARALSALTNLRSLDLYGCEIGTEGARALAALTNLTSLSLWRNEICDDGARALAALTSLTFLDLEDNHIHDEGARALAALTSLTSLRLSDNALGREGARALAAMTNLISLDLAENEIYDEGACALAALTNLTSLDLEDNGIRDAGAGALAVLSNLSSLNLKANFIGDEGARALAALTNLTSLDLSSNFVTGEGAQALLEAWAGAPSADRLKRLDLRWNGDLSSVLPAEVLETNDAQAILAAYRRYRTAAEQETLQPLNEAKLLVVGDEAVGKTSLIRYLVKDEPRDPNEPKTHGAQIHEKIETQAWSPEQGQVTLNVWDFGGQEMMRGTHRFFLTARSLYLLVLENRFEDDVQKVHEWLKTIRNRGGESPVIVVISKCDKDRPYVRKDDEAGLRDTYPNIVGFLRTACNDDDESRASIVELRKLIVDTIADDKRLEHVHNPLPASWLRVKTAVSDLADERSILHSAEFQAICAEGVEEEDKVADPDEQRALLRLLHDLGTVVAHGLERDAPAARREITLLDPNWLTKAIYTVLEKAASVEQAGEFSRSQLSEWLDQTAYPPERHEFILDMMQDLDIGLAARLPGSKDERYLVPRALPAKSPFYGNWPPDSIRLRYRYDFFPSDLFPRFVVEAHRELADPPTRWQTGAVLEAEGCPILVTADLGERRIDIAVDGRAGRGRMALGIVRNHLKAVHDRNPEVKPDERVPLKDQPELDVSFTHLLRLEEEEGPDYQYRPEGAERKYAVSELLEGVRPVYAPSRPHYSEEPMAVRFQAHGNAAVTIVGGNVSSSGGATTQLGTQSTVLAPSPTTEGQTPLGTFWHWSAVGCGVGAVLIAIVLMWLPDDSRLYVGGLLGLGLLVTLLVLWWNPRNYYRRWLSIVLPAGLLANALGPTIEAYMSSSLGMAWFRWDGATSWSSVIAWAIVVGILVRGDLEQRR
jgi:internalin A